MDYGNVLARSFEITKNHRALWVFGIVLAFFGGGSLNFPSWSDSLGTLIGYSLPTLMRLGRETLMPLVIVAVSVLLLFFLISTVLTLVCRGALIGLVQEWESQETITSVQRGLKIGTSRFGHILGTFFLIAISYGILFLGNVLFLVLLFRFLLTSIELSNLLSTFFWLLCILIFVLLLVFTMIAVHVILELSFRECVIQSYNPADSIKATWRKLRTEPGKVALLFVIAFALRTAFGILLLFLAIALVSIPIISVLLLNAITDSQNVSLLISAPIFMLVFLIALGGYGIYNTFDSVFWTEGYLALAKLSTTANT